MAPRDLIIGIPLIDHISVHLVLLLAPHAKHITYQGTHTAIGPFHSDLLTVLLILIFHLVKVIVIGRVVPLGELRESEAALGEVTADLVLLLAYFLLCR